MVTKSELLEMIQDTEKELNRLEKNGYEALSKKYLHYTNKLLELKTILMEGNYNG